MGYIPFFKMNGSGNDFIVIDNRTEALDEATLPQLIQNACRRKLSVGADGLVLIETSERVDFKWRFFNPDGSLAEMCGNGARCVARFAYVNGIAPAAMTFETPAGDVSAWVTGERVRLRMTDPGDWQPDLPLELPAGCGPAHRINTGVPHVVVEVEDLDAVDVVGLGRTLRHHALFAPAGTNVNFSTLRPDGRLCVRTYERGVEDETLACGTGSVAVALAGARTRGRTSPVDLVTRSGGLLRVHFTERDGRFVEVFLEGDARIVYEGRLWDEAWRARGED